MNEEEAMPEYFCSICGASCRPNDHQCNTDRAWCEFLDVLTARAPIVLVPNGGSLRLNGSREPTAEPLGDGQHYDNEFDDDENWRDGTMRDGMRRARRDRP